MTRRRFEMLVTGRVQGVGFRYFTQRNASELGLSGTVANLPDGSVRVEAEGPEEKLAEFVRILERGPSMSRVERLSRREIGLRNDGEFRIAHH